MKDFRANLFSSYYMWIGILIFWFLLSHFCAKNNANVSSIQEFARSQSSLLREVCIHFLPPATTAMAHTVFTRSFLSLWLVFIMPPRSNMAMCWHSNYIHFHPHLLFSLAAFFACIDLYNPLLRVFMLQMSVKNIYAIC